LPDVSNPTNDNKRSDDRQIDIDRRNSPVRVEILDDIIGCCSLRNRRKYPGRLTPASTPPLPSAFTRSALDLTIAPFRGDARIFDPVNYDAGQAFADEARAAAIEVLKYASVRDSERRPNFAILTPSVFTHPEPIDRQSWRIHLDAHGARAICEMPQVSLAFGRDTFSADVRIAGMAWER
jgi:hypothetical protein